MIIHICGASGSGKTTMLSQLRAWCIANNIDAGYLDIDDITNQLTDTILSSNEDAETRGKLFEKLLTTRVNDLAKTKKIYIIAGLIDDQFGDTVYYARLTADYTFCIKITDGQLLKQYLNRLIIALTNPRYVSDLIQGTASLIFDRDSLLRWAEDTRKLYCDTLKYTYAPYDSIIAAVKKHISAANKKSQ